MASVHEHLPLSESKIVFDKFHLAQYLARAWVLKETAMLLFDLRRPAVARKFFRRWYYWATHSRLEPIQAVARMMNQRLENILTYLKHGITNAVSKALNSKIQWVKYAARGFRNQQNFITAIYFHCGGLDLAL